MKTPDQLTLPSHAEKQLEKIESRETKIGVIGLGYVGLPLSLLLCEAGFTVKGFDIDERKVTQLEKGRATSSGYLRRIFYWRVSEDFVPPLTLKKLQAKM